MRELVASLQREMDPRRTATQAQTHLMLIGAGGKVWKVTVDANGLLQTVPFQTGGRVA